MILARYLTFIEKCRPASRQTFPDMIKMCNSHIISVLTQCYRMAVFAYTALWNGSLRIA